MAWATPVIAVAAAAPALAASLCTPETNFDSLTVGVCVNSLTFPPSSVTGTLTYSSTGNANDPTPGDTCRVERTSGTNGWNYVEMEMLSPLQSGDSVSVTITLSRPVENLSLLLHDIDSVTGNYRDTVYVTPAPSSYVLGTNIQGAGTSGNRFRPINWGDTPINEGAGRVRVTWAGPITTVTITYVAGITGSSQNQHIGLGNIRFDACVVHRSGQSARRPPAEIPGRESAPASLRDGGDRDS